jgi:hypothetical protein
MRERPAPPEYEDLSNEGQQRLTHRDIAHGEEPQKGIPTTYIAAVVLIAFVLLAVVFTMATRGTM